MDELKLKQLIKSAQPFILCETAEPQTTLNEISRIVASDGRMNQDVQTWDVLEAGKKGSLHEVINKFAEKNQKPWSVLVIKNIQFTLKNALVIQALQNVAFALKKIPVVIVGLCTTAEVPPELERMTIVTSDPLPSVKVLTAHGRTMLASLNRPNEGVRMDMDKLPALASLAKGLTLLEYEAAIAASATITGGLDLDMIHGQKAQLIRKSNTLEMPLLNEEDSFSYVCGLENMKEFVSRTCANPNARGILILGVPGVGKTRFARAVAAETGSPLLVFDMSSVYQGLVGASEASMKMTIKRIDAFGKCFLMLDEVEKSLAGANSTGSTDSGVGKRTTSIFLRWLSDRAPGAYIIATCNNVSALPPEYLRAERWDSIFFCDLPNLQERTAIWKTWRAHYKIAAKDELPNDTSWTGAEIRTCCRVADMLKCRLREAEKFVLPITKIMNNEIEELRNWAKNRTIPATLPPDDPEGSRAIIRDEEV